MNRIAEFKQLVKLSAVHLQTAMGGISALHFHVSAYMQKMIRKLKNMTCRFARLAN